MRNLLPFARTFIQLAVVSLLFVSQGVFAGDVEPGPKELLGRMAIAAEKMSYNGTVLRMNSGDIQTLRVAHHIKDGIVREKVLSLSGEGFEIIRTGGNVQCVIPNKKYVLQEKWGNKSTIFSRLPSSAVDFDGAYDLAIVREDRVAGRQALVLAIYPHDEFRYGHRLWLDKESAFPLKTELLDSDGAVLDQLTFADINLDTELLPAALQPSIDTQGFATYQVPSSQPRQLGDTGEWHCVDLPAGFSVVSSSSEVLDDADTPVVHIMYGDGLASVSVFISAKVDDSIAERSRVGWSNSFTLKDDSVQITAIGEVPAATVERIARSMRRL